MKKILSLAVTLALAVSAKALPLYFNGAVASDGVTLSGLLSGGWSQVYNASYGNGAITQTDISSWQAAAGSGYVFVGATDNNGLVIAGATGLASEVLSQTFGDYTAVQYSSSNLYWYNENNNDRAGPVGAMGFASTSTVNLYQADVYDFSDLRRLSWHLNYSGGGYRLGSIISFGGDYNRVVLVGQNAAVPEAASTVILLGAGLITLVGLRRRFAK